MLERRAEERSKGRMGNYKQLEHLSIKEDHCDEQTSSSDLIIFLLHLILPM